MAGEKLPRKVKNLRVRDVQPITIEEYRLFTVWTPPATLDQPAKKAK